MRGNTAGHADATIVAAGTSDDAEDWALLTRHLVALIRRDRAAGYACMDAADAAEAAGATPILALRHALAQYGGTDAPA